MSAAARRRTARRSLPLKINAPLRMGAAQLLAQIPDGCAALAIFDPQYRTGLDRLKYGNEGSRQKARYRLPQMTDDTIRFLVGELARVLRPSGHLMLWVDKFAVGSGQHLRYLWGSPLQVVDLIHWNKLAIGMGRRARCTSEYLVVAQRPPIRAKGVWTDHRINDSWPEQSDRTIHPHAKPTQLTERLIRSVTKRGDLVVDPCAGSFGVLHACHRSGRDFVGCDLLAEE